MSTLGTDKGESVAGTPTVNLSRAFYVIRATIFNPLKRDQTPLPPHYWSVFRISDKKHRVAGSSSDADGVSTVRFRLKDGDPQEAFGLALLPLPKDVRDAYREHEEAWIDLETNEWVFPPPEPDEIQRRPLLRIPAWSTRRKAAVGGGFKELAPGLDEATGHLLRGKMKPHGQPSAPWAIELDHGWIRARVRYPFMNLKGDSGIREDQVPPGLIVKATTPGGVLLGAGTSLSKTAGDHYLLIEQPQVKPAKRRGWQDVEFTWTAPQDAWIDIREDVLSGFEDERLVTTTPRPPSAAESYRLPASWHSFGQFAWFRAGPPAEFKEGERGPWQVQQLRLQQSEENPTYWHVDFHLDDVLLVDAQNTPASVDVENPLTVFDNLLQVHQLKIPEEGHPDSKTPSNADDAQRSDRSSFRTQFPLLSGSLLYPPSLLRSSDARGTAAHHAARLIVHRGRVYGLLDKRISGTPGKTTNLGCRVAILNADPRLVVDRDHPETDGRGFFELHYLRSLPGVVDTETGRPLAHLLRLVQFVYAEGEDVDSERRAQLLEGTPSLLQVAHDRWSPGHPSRGTTGVKNHALISKADPSGVLVRLACRLVEGRTSPQGFTLKILAGTEDDRSNVHTGTKTMSYYEPALRVDRGDVPSEQLLMKDAGDGTSAETHVLTHEVGHVLGLPDEYYEQLKPKQVIHEDLARKYPPLVAYGSYPVFGATARPYWSDANALMLSNHNQRLRYSWTHVQMLNTHGAFGSVSERPFRLQHRSYGPGGVVLNNDAGGRGQQNPWRPHSGQGGVSKRAGRSELFVFPLGDDEGTALQFLPSGAFMPDPDSSTILPPLAEADRYDAIVVVNTHYRFTFGSSVGVSFRHDTMHKLNAAHPDLPGAALSVDFPAFNLTGGSTLKKIAVVFHPLFLYENKLPLRGGQPVPDKTDITLRFPQRNPMHAGKSTHPFTQDALPNPAVLGTKEFEPLAAIRVAMGAKPYKQVSGKRVVNDDPISATDMAPIARAVDAFLGDPPGTRSVSVRAMPLTESSS